MITLYRWNKNEAPDEGVVVIHQGSFSMRNPQGEKKKLPVEEKQIGKIKRHLHTFKAQFKNRRGGVNSSPLRRWPWNRGRE